MGWWERRRGGGRGHWPAGCWFADARGARVPVGIGRRRAERGSNGGPRERCGWVGLAGGQRGRGGVPAGAGTRAPPSADSPPLLPHRTGRNGRQGAEQRAGPAARSRTGYVDAAATRGLRNRDGLRCLTFRQLHSWQSMLELLAVLRGAGQGCRVDGELQASKAAVSPGPASVSMQGCAVCWRCRGSRNGPHCPKSNGPSPPGLQARPHTAFAPH